MRQLWSFVGQKRNREILTCISRNLTVAIAGLWTALVYVSSPPKTPHPSAEANCGSVGIGGNVSGATITAGSTGECGEKP